MGTLITPPIPDSGVNCAVWNPPAETPYTVYSMFFSMNKCPAETEEPTNGVLYAMHQRDPQFCQFTSGGLGTRFSSEYDLDGLNPAVLELRDKDMHPHFIGHQFRFPPDTCRWANTLIACGAGIGATGGFAIIFWSGILDVIIEASGLSDADDIRLELFAVNPFYFVYKLCSLSHRVNARFKFLHPLV